MKLKLSIGRNGYLMNDTQSEEKDWDINQEEYLQYKKGYLLISIGEDGKLIKEYNEALEKEDFIKEYKKIKTEIFEVKASKSEIEESYETFNEQGKKLANLQLQVLNTKLDKLRTSRNSLVLSSVEKYPDLITYFI